MCRHIFIELLLKRKKGECSRCLSIEHQKTPCRKAKEIPTSHQQLLDKKLKFLWTPSYHIYPNTYALASFWLAASASLAGETCQWHRPNVSLIQAIFWSLHCTVQYQTQTSSESSTPSMQFQILYTTLLWSFYTNKPGGGKPKSSTFYEWVCCLIQYCKIWPKSFLWVGQTAG